MAACPKNDDGLRDWLMVMLDITEMANQPIYIYRPCFDENPWRGRSIEMEPWWGKPVEQYTLKPYERPTISLSWHTEPHCITEHKRQSDGPYIQEKDRYSQYHSTGHKHNNKIVNDKRVIGIYNNPITNNVVYKQQPMQGRGDYNRRNKRV